MLCTMMSLGELAVMYPVNGGHYEYSVRFLDPSWLVTLLFLRWTTMSNTAFFAFSLFTLPDSDADKMNLI